MTDENPARPRLPIDASANDAMHHLRYENVLRAVGGYIDEHGFTDVLVSQLPDGVLLKGTVIDRNQRSSNERLMAVFFTNEEIAEMVEASKHRRRLFGSGNYPY